MNLHSRELLLAKGCVPWADTSLTTMHGFVGCHPQLVITAQIGPQAPPPQNAGFSHCMSQHLSVYASTPSLAASVIFTQCFVRFLAPLCLIIVCLLDRC